MRLKSTTVSWPATHKFTISPMPGRLLTKCIPVGIFIRDITGYAQNISEVKQILQKDYLKVDGKIRRNYRFPLGIMDIVNLGEEFYRVLPTKSGLSFKKITKNEANIKLLRIENKTILKKKVCQLNMHDSTNINYDKECNTGDVAVFDLATKKIKTILKLKKGSKVLVINGKKAGSIGKVENLEITRSYHPNIVTVSLNGVIVQLPRNYVFVVDSDDYAQN